MANEEREQSTPDLDRVMMEGHPVFDGTGGVEPAPGAAGPAGTTEEGGAAAAPGTPPAATPKPSATPAGEAAAEPAAPAPAKKDEGEIPPEKAHRFKNHDEAEHGYRELQGRTTRAEQRAATAEKKLKELEGAEERRRQQEAADQSFIDFAAERREKAMAEIDELDPDDPEYKKKVAQAWGKADKDIFSFRQEPAAPAAAGTPQGEQPTPDGDAPVDSDMESIRTYTRQVIVKAGLPADDPLFWIFATQAPATNETGETLSMDAQIQWAIDRTKDYQARIKGEDQKRREEDAAAAGRAAQLRDLPMGGGGAGPAAGGREEAEQPVSLDAALRSAQRRL